MKKYTLLLFIFILSISNAQTANNVEDHQVQIGLPIPAILYEKGIGINTTLSIEAIFGFQYRDCSSCEAEFGIHPIVRGQYRYYYNMKRRISKGKNITGNTGNYIGALLLYQNGSPLFGEIENSDVLGVGPVYGIQRTYKRGFFYRLEGGVAYLQDDFDQGVGLVLAARIGWVLRKRP